MLCVVYDECQYAECQYAECLYAVCHCAECVVLYVIVLNVNMLNVTMPNVTMLNVIMPNVTMLNVTMLNITMLNVTMLNIIMLSVIMLSVIMLNDIMLNVMAPKEFLSRYETHSSFMISISSWTNSRGQYYKITAVNYSSSIIPCVDLRVPDESTTVSYESKMFVTLIPLATATISFSSSLTQRQNKVERLYVAWAQCCKTFYVSDLRIFAIS
jgi:hypothetical protein